MALQKTSWRPDTCGCEIEYTWDDTQAEDVRVHTPVKVVACSIHQSVGGGVVGKHTAVVTENRKKNLTVGAIIQADNTLIPEDLSWGFDGSRKLIITLPSKVKNKKSQFLTAIQALYPIGVDVI